MEVDPIIKWSGSKRSQAREITRRFPREIDTYYEPFCGGCSVLYRLLQNPNIKVKHYVASDINADLTATWNEIKNNPDRLVADYVQLWTKFNLCETFMLSPKEHRQALYAHRKEFFYEVRDRLNREHRPSDFLFIMRTTTNGMPRYNDFGAFNNSCHFSRPGIDPSELYQIAKRWSSVLKGKDVEFRRCSYDEIIPGANDLVYMDPPYGSLERNQMYFGGIDMEEFFGWLRNVKAKWIMSFDGKRGENDYTADIHQDLYSRHEYLNSGNSSFERYLGKGRTEEVYESLYMNYTPDLPKETTQQELTFSEGK